MSDQWDTYRSTGPATCAADTDCNDGDACNGVETCDRATGSCLDGTAPNCNDGNACTTDTCDPASGCEGTPVNCDVGNMCTDDSCGTTTGCVQVNNTASCSDGNACTVADVFSGGVCAGTPMMCVAGQGCQTGVCVPQTCTVKTETATTNYPIGAQPAGRILTGNLMCLSGSGDFDLYLQRYRGNTWKAVMASEGVTCVERISYTVPRTYDNQPLRWRVLRYSGTGTAELTYCTQWPPPRQGALSAP